MRKNIEARIRRLEKPLDRKGIIVDPKFSCCSPCGGRLWKSKEAHEHATQMLGDAFSLVNAVKITSRSGGTSWIEFDMSKWIAYHKEHSIPCPK